MPTPSPPQAAVDHALAVFELTAPVTREQVDTRYHALRHTWNPHRYANMTNNPRKYMQMYTKAEAMLKEIESAYGTLSAWLQRDVAERRESSNVNRQS